MRRFTAWLTGKWARQIDPSLLEDYRVVFNTDSGRRVLRHWMDSIYCTTYHGTDPIACATHNGRRSVIQEILENLDRAEQPDKYQVRREDVHDL